MIFGTFDLLFPPKKVNKKMNRAEASSTLLRSLNDAVEGNFLVEDIADILARNDGNGDQHSSFVHFFHLF